MSEGWSWFEATPAEDAAAETAPEIADIFARVFRGAEGTRALEHLKDLTLHRTLGPAVSDAMLRHVEGQRHMVAYMAALVARGRGL